MIELLTSSLVELLATTAALATWPWAPELVTATLVLLAVAFLAATFFLGRRSARRQDLDLGAEDVLTALERVVRGDRAGAMEVLQRSAQRPDAPAELYLAMASLLRAQGHVERSAQLHLAVTQRPQLSAVLATRAAIGLAADYLSLGRSRAAEELLARLPRKVRRQEALQALRRNAALRAGDWKEALSASGLLARGRGAEAASEVYSHMAHAALARGEIGEATGHYKRALRKDEDNLHAREGLARIYLAEGKLFRARRLIAAGVEQCPDAAPRFLPLMRLALTQRERYRRYLDDLADKGIGSPWVDLELAEIAYAEDNVVEALDILSDLVALYPESIDVREAYLNILIASADDHTVFAEVDRFMALAGARVPRFECEHCRADSAATFVKCASCGRTGTVRYIARAGAGG